VASVPVYIQAPHPEGYGIGELKAVMALRDAPVSSFAWSCDEAFARLSAATQSLEEIKQGARELVKAEPLHYHWCFYSKIASLHERLLADQFIDQKQKLVLETYAFLVPIARAFMAEFHDSRYLRWAVKNYRVMSEWVFYRKLELSPQLTSELVDVSNPFGAWKDITPADKESLISKYGLKVQNLYAPPPAPEAAALAASPAPLALGSPAPGATEEPVFTLAAPEPTAQPEPAPRAAGPADPTQGLDDDRLPAMQ
jgi:hypothetical protein